MGFILISYRALRGASILDKVNVPRLSGKQVKSVNITTKGKGSLTVYANDLSNGTYSYTLVVDGQIIDTKQMIKQQ